MAEITNNFLQGKMNKDLDERILPKGQYRDAMNIQIATSDGSDVGSAQSILGTKALSAIGAYDSTSVCIGSIKDTLTDCIYYFVRSSNRDFIAKYDARADYATFVAVDLSRTPDLTDGDGNPITLDPFLKFTGKQITAINIIDNYLFWSDGDNEPKKIDLSKNYSGLQSNPQSYNHHSRLILDGVNYGFLKEEHLTVIKKKPLRAPQIKVNSSKGNEKSSIFQRQIPRFCVRYKYEDNQLSAFSPFTQPVFNAEYIDDYNSNNFYDISESYNTAMLNYISSIEVYGFVDNSMPDDVVEVEILYKTEDSNVIYSIAKIKKTDTSWSDIGSYIGDLGFNEPGTYLDTSGSYVIRSENVFTAIAEDQFLRPFDNVPRKALAQEVVGNRIVYGNYTQNYDLDSVDIEATAAPYFYETQDKPVKSLKSDRSYQVGVLFVDDYGRETPVFTSTQGGFKTIQDLSSEASWKTSIKVNSNIPEWARYYKFYIKESSGQYYNLLNQRVYIPFSHSQFENNESHVYLSFPSKDRSKISVDDYIVLKTVMLEPTPFRVGEDNKYKVLDVSNEAPEAISYKFYDLGAVDNKESNILTSETTGIFVQDPSVNEADLQRIDQQTDTLIIRKDEWQAIGVDGAALTNSEGGGNETSNKVENLYVSWSLGSLQSKRYKVTNVRVSLDSNYIIRLSEVINLQDALIANLNGLDTDGDLNRQTNMPPNLKFKIQRKDRYSDENFSGHFFVKIAADELIKSQLVNQPKQIEATDKVLAAEKLYLWLDEADASASTTKNSNVQHYDLITNNYYGGTGSQPADITVPIDGNGITNSKVEWDNLLNANIGFGDGQGKFFIDGMYMAASNPSQTLYARESGQGWVGSADIRYPSIVWSKTQSGQNVDEKTGWRLEDAPDQYTAITFYNTTLSYTYNTSEMDATTQAPISFNAADAASNYVNGIEPIFQANADYTSNTYNENSRRWSNSTIYGSSRVDDLTNTYSPNGYYMHVSFLGPGEDLFSKDQDFPDGVASRGIRSLGNYTQGIWGGGAFNNGARDGFVEMEGHYGSAFFNNYNIASATVPGPNVKAGEAMGINYQEDRWSVLGYDLNYQEQHERQFDLTYGTDNVQKVQEIISNLVAGKKFRFSVDTNKEIYTILGVDVKRVYNHTPWRARKVWDGSSFVNGEDSVEEAVLDWATNNSYTADVNAGNLINAGAATGEQAVRWNTVLDRLEAFGAKSNRRVVYALKLDKDPTSFVLSSNDNTFDVDSSNSLIEFVEESAKSFSSEASTNKALFETEPEKSADLDIYYEISDAIPVEITKENKDIIFPIGSKVEILNFDKAVDGIELPKARYIRQAFYSAAGDLSIVVNGLDDADRGFNYYDPSDGATELDYVGKILAITRADGSVVHVEITQRNASSAYYTSGDGSGNYGYALSFKVKLSPSLPYYSNFYNVFAFGNGIESNTVRDDFNGVSIRTGARASTTLDEPYREEVREHGLIFSGLYNSNTGVNNLNQFIQAQKITKDLNPTYGSIQKLFQRQTNLVVFCEDRVVKVISNKDAIFNADGNPQLVANDRVLGQVTPFVGEFGISKNPESFASESYRAYFTDKQRRAVLRLSMDGLTPISDAGMKDWFGDNLADNSIACLGTYDDDKQEYNLTIKEGYNKNIIANDSFDDGVELVETYLGQNLVNTAFTGGSAFTDLTSPSKRAQFYLSKLIYNSGQIIRDANIDGTITHDLPSAPPVLEAGRWYMSEIESPYNTNFISTSSGLVETNNINVIADSGVALQVIDIFEFGYGSETVDEAGLATPDLHNFNQTDAEFRQELPYHFGQISGAGVSGNTMSFMLAARDHTNIGEPILLAIWKQQVEAPFSFRSWFGPSVNPGFDIATIKLYDITEPPSMSVPSGWAVQSENYTMPHAGYRYIEEFYIDDEYTEDERARPMVYYKDNAIQFNTVSKEYLAAEIYNSNSSSFDPEAEYLTPTHAGYNFSFTIGPNVDTGNISGNLYVRALIPDASGSGAGFRLSNVSAPGEYVINYNATSDYVPSIVTQPQGSDAQLLAGSNSTSSNYTFSFSQLANDTFEGSISNISILDVTPTFTGGGVDNWILAGFDSSVRNDLYWEKSTSSLVWDNVDLIASTGGVTARQNVGLLKTGDAYTLSFDYTGNTGTFKGYYYNKDDKGFYFELDQNQGHFSQNFIIGDNTSSTATKNALVLYFIGEDDNGASIKVDNIVFRSTVRENFNARTLSYSEQAKGWISFKSFIPESGVSLGGDYYTFSNGSIHKHHQEETNNNVFYDQARVNSYIDFIFNDSTPVIKDFKALSYEGSAGKRNSYVEHVDGATDVNYDNLNSVDGWFVSNIATDLQRGSIPEFIKKEGKYYNYIRGGSFDNTNSDDIGSLNVQGLGIIADVEYDQIIVD